MNLPLDLPHRHPTLLQYQANKISSCHLSSHVPGVLRHERCSQDDMDEFWNGVGLAVSAIDAIFESSKAELSIFRRKTASSACKASHLQAAGQGIDPMECRLLHGRTPASCINQPHPAVKSLNPGTPDHHMHELVLDAPDGGPKTCGMALFPQFRPSIGSCSNPEYMPRSLNRSALCKSGWSPAMHHSGIPYPSTSVSGYLRTVFRPLLPKCGDEVGTTGEFRSVFVQYRNAPTAIGPFH